MAKAQFSMKFYVDINSFILKLPENEKTKINLWQSWKKVFLGIKQWKRDDLRIRFGIWQAKLCRECKNIYAHFVLTWY